MLVMTVPALAQTASDPASVPGSSSTPAKAIPPNSASTSASAAGETTRYVTSDRLVYMIESEGLKNHAEAWQKTNASKLLTGTPVGAMLETVASQLIDQLFVGDATKKVTGAEIVSLFKHVAQNGWVFAINTVDKGPRPYRITLVLKRATEKSMRPVTSRLLGAAMGDIRPRIVKKDARTIVARSAFTPFRALRERRQVPSPRRQPRRPPPRPRRPPPRTGSGGPSRKTW